MEKNYFEIFDLKIFQKYFFEKSKNQNLKISKFEISKSQNFQIWNFEILRFWFFDFSKKIFSENFQIKIFKILFSMMKNIFHSNFFLRSGIELHFRFSILRAPVEVYRCLQTSTFNRRTGSKRLNIDDFSSIFNDFRWFWGFWILGNNDSIIARDHTTSVTGHFWEFWLSFVRIRDRHGPEALSC